MKYILAIITSVFLFTNIAQADTTQRNVVQSVVTHHYVTETIEHRISNRVCEEIDIPIYSTKDKTGNIIIGSILGGILGKQIGNDDGSTAIGAILGGTKANADAEKNKSIVGYKRTTVCEDTPTYEIEERQVYSHSTIRFTDSNSATYMLKFQQRN